MFKPIEISGFLLYCEVLLSEMFYVKCHPSTEKHSYILGIVDAMTLFKESELMLFFKIFLYSHVPLRYDMGFLINLGHQMTSIRKQNQELSGQTIVQTIQCLKTLKLAFRKLYFKASIKILACNNSFTVYIKEIVILHRNTTI